MAKKYNVLIFLIAHPRKSTGNEFGNDDVAGSSNITNLVDVVLKYSKPKKTGDEAPYCDRLLTVHKNRLTGRTNRDGIRLYYQEGSKRISENPETFDWDLGWNQLSAIRPDERIPFDEVIDFG